MNKELIKQLYINGLSAREIAEQLKLKLSTVKMCIQRNFKELKPMHLKNRKQLKVYENEVKKITKYESKQYMSDKTFILKNRSVYRTKENGDIVLKEENKLNVSWDTPRSLKNVYN